MKLLLDKNLSPRIADGLREAGHAVDWVGEWPEDPGDETILAIAHRQNLVLVTWDKDFGRLVFQGRKPHAGIIRIAGHMTVAEQLERLCQTLATYPVHDIETSIITIDMERERVTKATAQQ